MKRACMACSMHVVMLRAGPRCRVYLHDAARAAGKEYLNDLDSDHNHVESRTAGEAAWQPSSWRYDKYAQELWLQRALADHPWRVHDVSSADVVVLAANFSLLCAARKSYRARHLWHVHLNDTIFCNGSMLGRDLDRSKGNAHCRTSAPPKALFLTNSDCQGPWHGWFSGVMPPSRPPADVLMVTDRGAKRSSVLSPAVVAQPCWLTGACANAPPLRSWAARERLLFFAGRVAGSNRAETRHVLRASPRHAARPARQGTCRRCT